MMRLLALALVSAACAAMLSPSAAEARNQTSEEVSYPYERVWPAAVRYIRIDAGHPVEEKDEANGYILFVYKDEGREFRGALELIRIRDHEGRDAVRLVLRIDARPSYMERMMLNRLVRKLRDELGPPPPPPPAPAPVPDEDAEDEAAAPVYRRAP
jgi:hypothetical protein